MIGLGVQADQPVAPIQPPLADGIHLRWAVARELGFPWWGFYLYRRPSLKDGERTCISRLLGDRRIDQGATTLDLATASVSSDLAIRLTDDFPGAALQEVDLGGGRNWLKVGLPAGALSHSVDVRIGFRRQRECVDLRQMTRAPSSNPLRLHGLVLDIDSSSRAPSLIYPALRVEGSRLEGGLRVTREAVIHFVKPTEEARLLVHFLDGAGCKASAYASDSELVALSRVKRGQTGSLDLKLSAKRPIVRIVLNPERGSLALLQVCRSTKSEELVKIQVVARSEGMSVASAVVSGRSGDVIDISLHADRIDQVGFEPADASKLPEAALVELCFHRTQSQLRSGWQPVSDCPQPLSLPVFHPDYPASGSAVVDRNAAEAVALGRIHYGDLQDQTGDAFTQLHDVLIALVAGGPTGPGMADASRAKDIAADPGPPGSPSSPGLTAVHPLDLTLLASIHPRAAQMFGLYFVDRSALPGTRYDYLVIGDWSGSAKGNAKAVLEFWLSDSAGYEGHVIFNKELASVTPIAPPSGTRAFLLPANSYLPSAAAPGQTTVVHGLVGLHWTVQTGPQGKLLPDSPVLFHLWRKELGNGAVPAADQSLGDWMTKAAPILVAKRVLDPFAVPQRPTDWPDIDMHRLDLIRQEGWYAYRVSAMDLFGRISAPSARYPWFQWAPAPDPLPWYYQQPPSTTAVHAEAVRVLDKTPPPPPVGVEAAALDPADPYVIVDAPYTGWRSGLPVNVRDTLVGLRVTWRWTASQMRQAPDTREFRVYYSPGGAAPQPDHGAAGSWDQRVHVVAYGDNVTVAANGDRLYRIFLPIQPPIAFGMGLPLTPSLAQPIVYAHVGVSAVDGATHTLDNPKWAGGLFGNRTGNEGRLGAPAKIFRVLRGPPPAPQVLPADSNKVFATPADYHGLSYYSFRWAPQAHLKTHVLRAMDSSVFAIDRQHRPRAALSAQTVGIFPDQTVEPRWDAAKRAQIATELNALNGLSDSAAAAAYRSLSNDGLRILAGLPGNEAAFVQITTTPLDADDPAFANRVGPDNPPGFAVEPTLRCYVDSLDGRGTNRYFYRAASVDGAHNRSSASLSGPPIWLPNVVPPRAPVLTKAEGGEREVRLAWASNREADLTSYRVYGTDDSVAARDRRSMSLLATVVVPAGDPGNRPQAVTWTHANVPGLINRWYVITAVDDAGNESASSRVACARAHDEALPVAPALTVAWTSNAPPADAQVSWTSVDETRLERRVLESLQWDPVGDWMPPGAHDELISLDPALSWRLRLRVRKYTGALVIGPSVPLNHL